MAFAKFEKNRFRIDGEIAENHAILVNLTASIDQYHQYYGYWVHDFIVATRKKMWRKLFRGFSHSG